MTEHVGDYLPVNDRERDDPGCPPNVDFCDGGDACWDVCNAWRDAHGDEDGDRG